VSCIAELSTDSMPIISFVSTGRSTIAPVFTSRNSQHQLGTLQIQPWPRMEYGSRMSLQYMLLPRNSTLNHFGSIQVHFTAVCKLSSPPSRSWSGNIKISAPEMIIYL